MNKKELCISFHAPLNKEDSEVQTFGCRANNPDICLSADTENICAFVREDKICLKPSRRWKKQFHKLKEQENNNNKS